MEYIDCNLCGQDHSKPFAVIDGYRLVRCLRCGLVYLNPRPPHGEIAAQYSADYHTKRLLGSSPKTEEEIERAVLRSGALADDLVRWFGPKKRLLDIGCSMGFFLACMKRRGWDVQGLDISDWAAAFAREKLGLDCRAGTVESVRFDTKFDISTLFQTIEHFTDPLGSLTKIHDLIDKDGILMIKSPNVAGFDRLWHGKKWRGFHPPFDLYYFSPRAYRTMLERAGFIITRIVYQYWNPVTHLMGMRLGGGIRADHDPDAVITFDKDAVRKNPVYKIVNTAWTVTARCLNLKGRDLILFAKRKEDR